MNWFAIPFIIGVVTFIVWVHIAEARRNRRQAEQFQARQEQRRTSVKHKKSSDSDFQRVCRVLAVVAEEAMTPPGVRVDPSLLDPSDTIWDDLGYSLDSFAHANLIYELEKEFGRKLKWREFQEAATIQDIYGILFPDKMSTAPGGENDSPQNQAVNGSRR